MIGIKIDPNDVPKINLRTQEWTFWKWKNDSRFKLDALKWED